jgi:outer membrane protein OmpA-like peptidoglycan-associated protein
MVTQQSVKTQVVKSVLLMSLLTALSTSVFAENVVSFHGKEPSSGELFNAFMGTSDLAGLPEGLMPASQPQGTGGIKYRGISIKKKDPKPSSMLTDPYGNTQTMNGCQAKAGSVAVNINFKINSSNINYQDNTILDTLAEVMNAPQLQACLFAVEGHTDASGSAHYNLYLSRKRAESVKERLNQFQVASSRLVVVGRGEDEPLNPAAPYAAENRRVQFKVLNPAH